MIDEYKAARVSPRRVFPQSFDINDVLYWIKHEPAFGRQAVYLDDANVVADLPSFATLAGYKQMGINIWAPPTFALLALDGQNRIVPSQAARDARAAGLDLITWTLERSGILADGNNGFYYQTIDHGDQARRGPLQGDRRACAAGGDSRRVLGLGSARDVLRQLHGPEVAPDRVIGSSGNRVIG